MKHKFAKALLIGLLAVGLATSCGSNSQGGGGDTPVVPTKTVTSISITTSPTKVEYKIGEELDLTGMVVTAYYSDKSHSAVTGYTHSNPDMSTAGQKEVTITYEGKSVILNIVVSDDAPVKTLTSIGITTDPAKKEYFVGEELDLTGMVVTAYYSDESSEVITDYTHSEPDMSTAGQKEVVISYEGKSVTLNITVSSLPKTDWTEDEAKIMSDNLHGFVLPFYKEETSVLLNEGLVIIRGGEVKEGDLSAYMGKFPSGFAFEDVSASYQLDAGSVFSGEAALNTEAGTRYLRVFLYAFDERGNPSKTGTFYCSARDPYQYEFPSTFAQEYVSNYFFSKEAIPEFEADYYESSLNDGAVYCYTTNTSAASDYSTLLTNAGWHLQEEKTEGYFGAYSPSYQYQVFYNYSSRYGSLDIYLQPLFEFPTLALSNFFTKYEGTAFDVLPIESSYYMFKEGDLNEEAYEEGYLEFVVAYIFVGEVLASDYEGYLYTVGKAGYEIVTDESGFSTIYIPVEGLGIGKYQISYNSEYETMTYAVYLKLDPIPESQWPSDEIEAILGKTTDKLPEYTGENSGFQVVSDYYGTMVIVNVAQGTETECADTYNKMLTDAGWTEYDTAFGSVRYLSPNKEIVADAFYGTAGSFSIEFFSAVFPSEEVEAYLKANGSNDKFPAMEGVYGVEIEDTGYGAVSISTSGKDQTKEAATIVSDYATLLQESGYALGEGDYYGDPYYVTSDGKIGVCPYNYNGNIYIEIFRVDGEPMVPPTEPVDPSEGEDWPLGEIEAIIGEDLAAKFPALDGADSVVLVTGDYKGWYGMDVEIMLDFGDASADKVTEYLGLLSGAGFTESDKEDYGGNLIYVSEDGSVGAFAYLYNNYVTIDLYIYNTGVEWPAEEIADAMDVIGTEFVLPEFTGVYNSVDVESFSETVWVDIELADSTEDGVTDAFYLYLDSLAEADESFFEEGNYTFEYDPDTYLPTKMTVTNGEVIVAVKTVYGYGVLSIEVKKAGDTPVTPTGGFPSDEIKEVFPDLVFPTIDDENVSFVITGTYNYDYYHMIEFTATFVSEDDCTTALNAYKQALLDMGYTEDAYGDFITEDGKVAFYFEVEGNKISFSIYDYVM